MKFNDLFQEVFISILSNKTKSSLTVLGIVIGIGSVVAMMSIGQGAKISVQESIQSVGSNLLVIYPGAQKNIGMNISGGRGSAQTLSQDDADAVENEIDFIRTVAPEISKRYQVTAKGTNTNTSIIGTTTSYSQVKNLEMDVGSFISEQNVKSLSKIAVLGPTTRDDLFGEGVDPIGQKIRINRINFTVIGLTEAKGGTGFGSQDDIIFIPISTAQRYLSGDDYVSGINVQVQNEEYMTAIQEQITKLLLDRHNISNPQLADFSIMNQAAILNTMNKVTNTFTIFLGAIASISLIVGGIGIMNMMLTTVTERTREIGLRKAIGSKNKDIHLQFLTEAIVLTFIGGIMGIIFGVLVSFGINHFTATTTSISMFSIILAFSVSGVIGIGFGYYPAKQAAKLNPIEALRYE
ncbi:MAG: ABC transporter permease [Candidatus Aenigmarchaeota archaeon]|nr:ABC transporter permease [Candidatus Aenigmarchaeota archaeon]